MEETQQGENLSNFRRKEHLRHSPKALRKVGLRPYRG